MIRDRWQQVLERHRARPALLAQGVGYTFAELDAGARALLLPGSGPVIAQGGAPEVMIAILAALLNGRCVQVVEKDRTQRVPQAGVPVETFLIKQTVGATGVRRCQYFTGEQLLADVDRLHEVLGLQRCDATVSAISPAHSYGLTVTVLQTLFHGLPMQWVAEPFPEPLCQALRQHERPFLPGIPALWRAWLMAKVPIYPDALCVSAGSPLTLELEQKCYAETGHKLHNLYGTSESGAVSYDGGKELRGDASYVGQLLPGVQVTTEQGRLSVHSDAVGLGYDEPLAGERFGGGCFVTTDHGALVGDALHWYACCGTGINVAGRKIAPEEIAAKLCQVLGPSAVTIRAEASRDPERCQQVVAMVDLPAGELTAELKKRACAALAPWELPRRWECKG
jgi:long-chain acyl-CoA synthetase